MDTGLRQADHAVSRSVQQAFFPDRSESAQIKDTGDKEGFSKGMLQSADSKVIAPAFGRHGHAADFRYKFSRPKRSTRAIQTSSFKNLSSRPAYAESVILPVV